MNGYRKSLRYHDYEMGVQTTVTVDHTKVPRGWSYNWAITDKVGNIIACGHEHGSPFGKEIPDESNSEHMAILEDFHNTGVEVYVRPKRESL